LGTFASGAKAALGKKPEEMREMIQDPYEDFAQRYDLFFKGFGQHDPVYVAFFRSLFAENQVQRVLDCACGIGQDLHLFHSLGCQAYGSDISDAMLAQARQNLSGCGMDIPLKRADFRELPRHFEAQFDAVVCLSTSLPHLLEEVEVIRALASMREVLRDGGILVLSQGMCDKQIKERPRFIPAINTRDFSRVFVMEYFDETMRINVLDLFHSENEQDFKANSFEYQIILQDDYERLLAQVGYRDIQCYGTYRFDPYDKEQSDRLIVVARR
jgi:glycine/sarcosine N-methyltransferase